jgi:type II pantothenate kinase
MVIGIDIGGTTTKIVGLKNKTVAQLLTVTASDPLASASGALGKLIDLNMISLTDIEKIIITGVGASYVKSKLMGLPVTRIDEFMAIGLGGLFLSQKTEGIVVSMGTGTAIVRADRSHIMHLGGTGIGGGTLTGLSKCILNSTDITHIIDLAQTGNLMNIDLVISDISKEKVGALPDNATASNFGKISDKAGMGDYALGIINLIFQTIGVMAVFASRSNGLNDIILTGKLAQIPLAKIIFEGISKVYKVKFIIPENAAYATAVGAAIS